MKCPKCDVMLKIGKVKYESPIDSTDVFLLQEMICTNKQCDNFNKVIETKRTQLKGGEQDEG